MNTRSVVALWLLVSGGCSDSGQPAPSLDSGKVPPGGTDYAEIRGSSTASHVPFDLCSAVRHPMWDGWGLYEVKRLTGVTEEDLRNPGTISGFTYAELTLVEEWHRAESEPIVRMIGGPFPGGDTGGWSLSLKVGDRVGLFLIARRAENRGYFNLDWLGTFHQRDDGGYSNGQLFTSRIVDEQELGSLVKGLVGPKLGEPCPYNEQPDYPGYSPPARDAATQRGDGDGGGPSEAIGDGGSP